MHDVFPACENRNPLCWLAARIKEEEEESKMKEYERERERSDCLVNPLSAKDNHLIPFERACAL